MAEKRLYSDTKKGIKSAERRRDERSAERERSGRYEEETDSFPIIDRINEGLTRADKLRISKKYSPAINTLYFVYQNIINSGLSENEKDKYLDAVEKRTERFEREAARKYDTYKPHRGFAEADESEAALSINEARHIIDAISKRRNKQRVGLEHKILAILTVTGILVGLFFLSPNLTGNIIGNLNQISSNYIGVILLIASLVGGFFWLKGSKR